MHRGDGSAVAIKALRSDAARDPETAALLRREGQVVAGLVHPAIVEVLDAGVVGDGDALPGVDAGVPWLAMGLAPGSLADRAPTTWEQTRTELRGILQGLAHAHAHGVVHGDLKPANVLLPDRPGGSVRLTDFGISVVLQEERAESDLPAGTPRYMAPEQCGGNKRDYGPWTDLYALGCLAWERCCTEPLFGDRDALALVFAHTIEEPPPPPLRSDVPPGVADRLLRLLRKDPADRFRHAVDALRALPGVEMPKPPSSRLWGAGPGLFGLIPPPLTGRREARAALLDAVGRLGPGRVEVVTLLGGPGSGKTRLARDAAVAAGHQRAAATLLVSAAGEAEPGDALRRTLARRLGCAGLAGEALSQRVEGLAGVDGAFDAQALVELLAPGTRDAPFERPRQRRAAALLGLDLLGRDRPLVVVVDDAHDSADAVELVREAQAAARARHGLLLVLTVRDDLLSDRPDARAALESLDAKRVSLGPLPPGELRQLLTGFAGVDDALANQLAGRSGGAPGIALRLLEHLVQRGALVPGPAGLRLSDGVRPELPDELRATWQDKLAAVAGEPGATTVLRLLAALGQPATPEELDGAAVRLGEGPVRGALPALVARRLVDGGGGAWWIPHPTLVELLRAERREGAVALHAACAGMLAERPTPGGHRELRLAHHLLLAERPLEALELLPAALMAAVDRVDRWALERVVALGEASLRRARIPAEDPRQGWLRLARLRHAAHYGDAASVEPQVERLVALASRVPGWERIRAEALGIRGVERRNAGRFDEAEGDLRASADWFAAQGEAGRLADAWIRLGFLDRDRGQLPDAQAAFEQAEEHARRGRAAIAWCRARSGRAEVISRRGDLRGADRLYSELMPRARELGAVGLLAAALGAWGYVLASLHDWPRAALDEIGQPTLHGDWPRAALAVDEGLAHSRRIGAQGRIADLQNLQGDIARLQGNLDAARRAFAASIETSRRRGHTWAFVAYLNLGQVENAAGNWAMALQHLEFGVERARAKGRRLYAAFGEVLMLPGLAGTRQWTDFDARLAVAARELQELDGVDPDIARAADLAGAVAAAGGEPGRAGRAFRLAAALWTRLDRPEDAAASRARAG